ncbi:hypothetical protein LFADAHJC_LOCUS3108 [Methylorubrum extorquens]
MNDTTNRTDDLAVIQYGATDPRAVPLPSDQRPKSSEQPAEAQDRSDGGIEPKRDDTVQG